MVSWGPIGCSHRSSGTGLTSAHRLICPALISRTPGAVAVSARRPLETGRPRLSAQVERAGNGLSSLLKKSQSEAFQRRFHSSAHEDVQLSEEPRSDDAAPSGARADRSHADDPAPKARNRRTGGGESRGRSRTQDDGKSPPDRAVDPRRGESAEPSRSESSDRRPRSSKRSGTHSRDDRPRGEPGGQRRRTRRPPPPAYEDGDEGAIFDDPDAPKPRIISRGDHSVSRRDVDPDALNILYRLHNKGHRGYLVGGGVRDLMLGLRPKDFDIATDARPGRLKRLFSNCRIIGRRFRLAHIHFGEKIIEVATFRSSGKSDDVVREGDLIHRDNVFGSPGEDAMRRDLTINGLFYDISTFSIIDYVNGFDDLLNGVVRTIVDPEVSFREDPVRMLRVIRHATRLDFEIEAETRRALTTQQDEILKANAARLLEEFYKDLSSGRSRAFFDELHRTGFLSLLVEPLVTTFKQRGERAGKALFFESLERLDRLSEEGIEITHPLGLAALLSPLILPVTRKLAGRGDEAEPEPFQKALSPVFTRLKIYRRDE